MVAETFTFLCEDYWLPTIKLSRYQKTKSLFDFDVSRAIHNSNTRQGFKI